MTAKLKFFGWLVLLLVVLAAAYLVAVSFINLGARGEASISINSQKIKVEIVDTPLAQARGFGGRDSIAENEGMLFVFPRPAIQRFWMKGMKFPIDIIWIAGDQIVGFEENVRPEFGVRDENLKIYSSPEPVDKVLEMKEGSIQTFGIKIGGQVTF